MARARIPGKIFPNSCARCLFTYRGAGSGAFDSSCATVAQRLIGARTILKADEYRARKDDASLIPLWRKRACNHRRQLPSTKFLWSDKFFAVVTGRKSERGTRIAKTLKNP